MKNRELRVFSVKELRVVRADGGAARITGHAAVFNSLSEELWGFRERIQPGAFKNTLAADVRALFNHDPNFVLGRTKSGTLRLKEDEVGLAIDVDAPDTQIIRDLVLAPIDRGDITQMSFGFRTVTDRWNTESGQTVRTLVEVELFDVSPVTFPAYPDTDVAVRSLKAWRAKRTTDCELGGECPMTETSDGDDCPKGDDCPEERKRASALADLDLRQRRLRLAQLQ